MRWILRHPWVPTSALLVAIFAFWAVGTRHEPHHLRAVFSDAPQLFSGQDVRIAGVDAGKISSVKHEDGRAIIGIGIDDDAWPLHRGTTATVRFGTTIGNGTRRIDIKPGPRSAPKLPENGVITNDDTVEAVEFDDLFDTLDAKSRTAFQQSMRATGDTFAPRERQLRTGVRAAGPGMTAVGDLARQLASDQVALRSVVADGHRVTAALARGRTAIADTISNAATTFSAFADNGDGVQASLDRFPPALREMRTTMTRLDKSLGGLDALVGDLAPGARRLDPLARALRPALADLRATVPQARAAFRTTRTSAPAITRMLREVAPFAKDAAPAFDALAPIAGCISPYAPEVAGLLSTWSSFTQSYDGGGHTGRLWANLGPTSLTATPPVKTPDFMNVTGQGYALIRPPGYNAGKPHYLPECGAGREGLDPAKDPEDG